MIKRDLGSRTFLVIYGLLYNVTHNEWSTRAHSSSKNTQQLLLLGEIS